jgi:hypothetical protein
VRRRRRRFRWRPRRAEHRWHSQPAAECRHATLDDA